MVRRILVVNGWSNAGKTTFTRWLEANRDFDRVDFDEGEIVTMGLNEAFAKADAGDATALRQELDGRPKDTVIDMPYLPPTGFPFVLSLQTAGVPAWWFDADPDEAQKSFSARAQGDLKNPEQGVQANFTRLRAAIERWHAVIQHMYGTRFVRTLFAGGARVPTRRIWETVCAVEGWTP
jgi:hypothetical protein